MGETVEDVAGTSQLGKVRRAVVSFEVGHVDPRLPRPQARGGHRLGPRDVGSVGGSGPEHDVEAGEELEQLRELRLAVGVAVDPVRVDLNGCVRVAR
jgi:hypothetical protein